MKKPAFTVDQLLSDTLFPEFTRREPNHNQRRVTGDNDNSGSNSSEDEVKSDPLASKVWRLYTKAKDNLPNGARMENLTWRMMTMTLAKSRKVEPIGGSTGDLDDFSTMVEEHDPLLVDETIPSDSITPPSADDTTSLLSSSAPPYTMMIDSLRDDESLQELRNVMVSGSSRASTTSTELVRQQSVSQYVKSWSASLSFTDTQFTFLDNSRKPGTIIGM